MKHKINKIYLTIKYNVSAEEILTRLKQQLSLNGFPWSHVGSSIISQPEVCFKKEGGLGSLWGPAGICWATSRCRTSVLFVGPPPLSLSLSLAPSPSLSLSLYLSLRCRVNRFVSIIVETHALIGHCMTAWLIAKDCCTILSRKFCLAFYAVYTQTYILPRQYYEIYPAPTITVYPLTGKL